MPVYTSPVASRNKNGLRISFDTDMPESDSPSSPPSRFCDHQRLVDPRQRVGVQRVDLADLLLHLADLRQQAAGKRRERQEAFFDLDALGREGEKEVRARVRIDDRLERRLGFVQLERRAGLTVFLPAAPTKLPMTAMSGLKIFDSALVLP